MTQLLIQLLTQVLTLLAAHGHVVGCLIIQAHHHTTQLTAHTPGWHVVSCAFKQVHQHTGTLGAVFTPGPGVAK